MLMFIFDSSNDTVTCRKESFYIYLYGLKLYLPTQIPGFLSFLAEGTFEPQVFCYFSSDSQKKNLAIKINKIDNHWIEKKIIISHPPSHKIGEIFIIFRVHIEWDAHLFVLSFILVLLYLVSL